MKKLLLCMALFPGYLATVVPADSRNERVIEIHARRFAFQPDTIRVKSGEAIRLRLISDDVPHSLQVKELGIDESATRKSPGEAAFTASHAGTFHGRCGHFCGEGHGRMSFTVEVDGN